MFSLLREYFRITLVATEAGPVVGNGGPASFAELGFDDAGSFDILLVPGGMGTRASVTDARLIAWLGGAAAQAEYVLTVCTGSALLAKTGFLDRQKATTSKAAFDWVKSQRPEDLWQPKARWVQVSKTFTSSGASAGIDMALAAIADMHGHQQAEEVAFWAEYEWNADADDDRFGPIVQKGLRYERASWRNGAEDSTRPRATVWSCRCAIRALVSDDGVGDGQEFAATAMAMTFPRLALSRMRSTSSGQSRW